MKKRILLFTLVAGIGALTISSYVSGPAFNGQNRTGALGSPTTCGGAGCHGTGTGPTVTITLDSGSTPVTSYVPGKSYTVKIHGAGSTNTHFGFEFAAVSGTGASQVQAGTSSGFPANVVSDPLSGVNFVEQDALLTATSAGVYDVSFTWTAPTTGVGNITLYSTVNTVNGDNIANAADVSGNTSIVLRQEANTGINNVLNNVTLIAFPNPFVNNLQLQMENAAEGTYGMQVFGLDGKMVSNEQINVSSRVSTTPINTAAWVPGLYSVVLSKDNDKKVIMVVKQ